MKSHTTKRNYKDFIQLCILFVITAIMFSGCNTGSQQPGTADGTASPATAYFNGVKTGMSTAGTGMNIKWSIDGLPLIIGKNISDMAWHVLTLTVESMQEPLVTPIAVNGLKYAIYPAPKTERGEKVDIEDINCQSAKFSKNGDSCSVYIMVSYDTATGIYNPPLTTVQLVAKAYPTIPTMVTLYVRPSFKLAQGNYRAILPIESKYYVGSAVMSNPKQYRILSMQNVSMPPLTITELTKTTNPAFTLMHRQSIESSDPYYGPYSECSLTANANLNQVNYLPGIDSQCILVYQASVSSNQATQTENVTMATNADITAPWTTSTLKLIANYVTAAPLPDSAKNGADFTVVSGTAVPDGTAKLMHTDGVLSSGTITTAVSFNLVKISYNFIARQANKLVGTPKSPTAPYRVHFGDILTRMDHSFVAGQQIVSDASSTNPVTVGKVEHSGDYYYGYSSKLAQLGNFNLQNGTPSGVGLYKQSLNVILGNESALVIPVINCPIGTNVCTATAIYSNELSSTSMSYHISLGGGDTLISGKFIFGDYELSDFIISR